MMKRGKIAVKAIHNLMILHGHHRAASSATTAAFSHRSSLDEYEFSCSSSPAFRLPFHLNMRKNNNHHYHAPAAVGIEDELMYENAVVKALEMLESEAVASPVLLGSFGRSPMVRQLRATDLPFQLKEEEDWRHVDEAAEKFIAKFYKNLRRQYAVAALGSYSYMLKMI